MSPITRAAVDEGTGSRGRKSDASLDCHPDIDQRWFFAAHRNPLGGQKRLDGLALPPEVSVKTLLIPTRRSGATLELKRQAASDPPACEVCLISSHILFL